MLRNISFPPCLERSDASYFCFLGKTRHYFPLPGSPWAHHLSFDRAPVLAIGCTTSCSAQGFAHTQCQRAGRRGQLLLLNSNPRSWRDSRGAFPTPPPPPQQGALQGRGRARAVFGPTRSCTSHSPVPGEGSAWGACLWLLVFCHACNFTLVLTA